MLTCMLTYSTDIKNKNPTVEVRKGNFYSSGDDSVDVTLSVSLEPPPPPPPPPAPAIAVRTHRVMVAVLSRSFPLGMGNTFEKRAGQCNFTSLSYQLNKTSALTPRSSRTFHQALFLPATHHEAAEPSTRRCSCPPRTTKQQNLPPGAVAARHAPRSSRTFHRVLLLPATHHEAAEPSTGCCCCPPRVAPSRSSCRSSCSSTIVTTSWTDVATS